ncbi:MAG: leucine-rich repeat domain-containing protein, partial [Proteobacteria bacterium]
MRTLPSPENQRTAYKEAKRRVAAAISAGSIELDFSDLEDLADIPANISKAKSVRNLSLEDTCISDLTPLLGMDIYSLDLDDTNVIDLSPLEGMTSLYSLYFSRTLVHDIGVVRNLPKISSLRMEKTNISDLSPISNLKNLRYLYASGTKITDLSPVSSIDGLMTLHIGGTNISDLTPLRSQKKISDLNISGTKVSDLSPLVGISPLFSPVRNTGLTFYGCENLPPSIQEVSAKKNPGRSLEVGRIIGASKETLDQDAESDFLSDSHLTQRPAPYSFVWIGETLKAQPHVQAPFDETLASEIISVVLEKLQLCLESMVGNEADYRVE